MRPQWYSLSLVISTLHPPLPSILDSLFGRTGSATTSSCFCSSFLRQCNSAWHSPQAAFLAFGAWIVTMITLFVRSPIPVPRPSTTSSPQLKCRWRFEGYSLGWWLPTSSLSVDGTILLAAGPWGELWLMHGTLLLLLLTGPAWGVMERAKQRKIQIDKTHSA